MRQHAANCWTILTAPYRALACLVVLVFLTLSLSGCGAKVTAPQPQPQPLVLRPERCPRPAPPVLPVTKELAFLESREGYAILKLRDVRLRAYIEGLNAALDCYDAQTGGGQ